MTSTSVVQTRTDPFAFPFSGTPQRQEQQALGSGFVIDKAGHVVTNYHVVAHARSVEVSFSANDSVKAKIIGSDPSTDLAVLKIDTRSRALTPLRLGDSDAVQVGDSVVAIGNPFGLDRTVTAGIVSAVQRNIMAPNQYGIGHVIQTDAPINKGNSGGPLLAANGQVIGVNSQISTGGTGEGNVGIGFAVPVNTVRDVVAQLIRSGKVEHPFLGLRGRPITSELSRLFRVPTDHGLLVEHVYAGGGASKAGLRGGGTRVVVSGETYFLGGDVILKADGVSIDSPERLRSAIATKEPGDTVELQILRGRERRTVRVKLGQQPASPPTQ